MAINNASTPLPIRRVPLERTGWRDAGLSQRHRQWGVACPAADIDLLLMEVDRRKVTALVEYKGEFAPPQFVTHPTYLAMASLGDAAEVPVFATRYSTDFTVWKVTPLNRVAKKILPERQQMSERQWVTFLYNLRGQQPPEEIFQLLERAI